MFSVSQYEDRYMMACSVPPEANEKLSQGFKDLSRIHFYLGNSPINHMIEAVEQASLHDVERGQIQIYFATKEIQDFLGYGKTNTLGINKLESSLYFDETFKKILQKTNEALKEVYKYPLEEENFIKTTTMLGLVHEVTILQEYLSQVSIKSEDFTELMIEVKNNYEKVYKLKDSYDNLKELKPFDTYKSQAQHSVLEQLKEPYEFNYTSLANIYLDQEDWMHTLLAIKDRQKDIDTNPDYKFDEKYSQRLKDSFLKQIKSFNRLLQNGVVNYVLSYAASISKESFYNSQNSKISAQEYFDRELNYHQKRVEKEYGRSKDYHQEKLDHLLEVKNDFIEKKLVYKTYLEENLKVLHRQEVNIFQTFDKIRENLFNIEKKDALTLTGDIKTGFVIGQFDDKVILIHKDDSVNASDAVYAGIMSQEKYEDLVNSNQLKFDESWKENQFEKGSNFWSYGQLLQELSDKEVKNSFLGKPLEIIDQTTLDDVKKTKKSLK